MRSLASFATAALLVAACASPRSAPPLRKVEPFKYAGFASSFPTGMRLVAYELPYMTETVVSASYAVGTVDDPPGKEGLAQVVEHLAFEARPRQGPRVVDRLLARGGEVNGVTTADSTVYYAIGEPGDLPALLEIEADRLREPLAGIDGGALERAREVVIREIGLRHGGGAAGLQLHWLEQLALAGTLYARTATVETVRAITLEDVRQFVSAYYVPARVVLAVAGPTQARGVAERTIAAFGDLATGDGTARIPPARSTAPVPAFDAPVPPGPAVREAAVDRPVLWVGWAVPGESVRGGPRAIAAVPYVEQRLRRAAARIGGRVGQVMAGVDRKDGGAVVWGRVDLGARESAAAYLSALRVEMENQSGLFEFVDYVERTSVRDQLLYEGHLALENLDVTRIGDHLRNTGEPDYVAGWQKTVAVALSLDTREWTGRYLAPQRMVSVLVVPGGDAAPAADIDGASPLTADTDVELEPALELLPTEPLAIDHLVRLGSVERRRLANGLEVVVASRPGFRAVTTSLVVRSTGHLDAVLQRLALASSGLAPGVEVGPYHLVRSARVASEQLETALYSLQGLAAAPRLRGSLFDALRDGVGRELARSPDPGPSQRLGVELMRRLYPGGVQERVAPAERVRAFAQADAERFLRQTLRPERATLIVAGAVESTDELWQMIERRFGEWRGAGEAADEPSPSLAPGPARRAVVVLDRPGAAQDTVVVGVRAPCRVDRDEAAFRVLVDRLDARLRRALRDRSAVVSDVWTSVLEMPFGSSLFVETQGVRGDVPRLVQGLLGALDQAAEPLDGPDLARARFRVGRQFLRGFGTSGRNATRLAELVVHGLPADEWELLADGLAALTPERVQSTARSLGLGREVVVISGDAATIVPALRAVGIEAEIVR